MKHLETLKALVAGSDAMNNILDAESRFVTLCKSFSAYDFQVVRMQIYRFFEDRHIKVSLFIQDKIQGLDGTIYLDFCNQGPIESIKPGLVKFFNPETGKQARTKQIELIHSSQYQPYPASKSTTPPDATANQRLAIATRPHLGANIYAAERKPLPIPWKPNTQADQEIEQIKIKKAKAAENAAKNQEEENKGEDSAVTDEFNQLANLIGQ